MSAPDLLGAFQGDFIKSSLDVYVGLTGGLRYVGKTQPQTTVRFPRSYMEFKTGTPKTRYIIDFSETGLEVDFTFMQVADPSWLAIALEADLDTSGTTHAYAFLGSDPGAVTSREWRFVGQTRDARLFELVIRAGQIMNPGDLAIGGDDYASQQVTISAVQDTTITDVKRDLAYFRIAKRAFS